MSGGDEDEARAVMYGLGGKRHPEEWTPTETLFAFMGWMTVRHHNDDLNDCALMVHRIRQFCERHDLRCVCTEGWEQLIRAEEPDAFSLEEIRGYQSL